MNVPITTGSRKSSRRNSRARYFRFDTSAVRLCAAGVLFVLLTSPVFAQKSVDFVLLLDNSESMFRQNGNKAELMVSDIMKNRLSYRDRFHLISFAGEPEHEIDRVLRDKESIQEVLARLMMLQPLEEDTDIVSALKFLTEYMSELPLNSEKQVVIYSDDIHEPPEESLFREEAENAGRIETIASYFKRNGWKVNVILFSGGETGSGTDTGGGFRQTGLLVRLAELLGTEVTLFSGDTASLADITGAKTAAEGGTGGTEGIQEAEAEGSEAEGREKAGQAGGLGSMGLIWLILIFVVVFILLFLLIRRVFGTSGTERTAPRQPSEGAQLGMRRADDREQTSFTRAKSDATSILSEAKGRRSGERETPYGARQTESEEERAGRTLQKKPKSDSGVSVLSAFAARERGEREGLTIRTPGRTAADRGSRQAQQISQFKGREGQTAIEMRVDFQRNTFRKNTRWFDEGSSYSVGQQGVADFEITSIDVSGVIASVRRKGDKYVFTPEQPEYFPDVKKGLENCLNRNIRIISPDTGFATTVKFHQWLSPLDRLNRMLHVIDKPGKPDPDIE